LPIYSLFAPQLARKQERNISDCYQRSPHPISRRSHWSCKNSGATGVASNNTKIERFKPVRQRTDGISPESG